jgi:signal transduction histidine kinase
VFAGQGITYGLKISRNAINHIMLENNPKEGLGYSGESYLVGNDSLMRSRSRFIENSILNTVVNTESVKDALSNKAGTLIINDYRNIPVLSSYEKLRVAGLNWVVIAEIDEEEAFQPVKDIRQSIFILTIALSASFFIVIYMLTHKIIKPLVSLNDATKKLTEGIYVEDLKVVSNDEIGELANSFNILSATLKKNYEDLEYERRKRFSLVMDAQEKEKERLSRELHDGIGQLFIALKLKLESIKSVKIKHDSVLDDVENNLDNIIAEIRLISNNLMPAVLQELGLIVAIRNICQQLSILSNIQFHFDAESMEDVPDRKKKIYIFRIIQEALNNVVKYSEASNCEIKLIKNEKYQLLISDDGKGFDFDNAIKGSGNGLYNIRERVLALGGKVNIETSPGNGTLIIINIPIDYEKN